MTKDAFKAVALEAVEEISKGNPNYSNSRPSEIEWTTSVFIRRLQPLVDADRQEIERLKKALRFYADKENYNKDIPGCNDGVFWICDGGNTACTALGEEK